jgi:acid phosphatase class B
MHASVYASAPLVLHVSRKARATHESAFMPLASNSATDSGPLAADLTKEAPEKGVSIAEQISKSLQNKSPVVKLKVRSGLNRSLLCVD